MGLYFILINLDIAYSTDNILIIKLAGLLMYVIYKMNTMKKLLVLSLIFLSILSSCNRNNTIQPQEEGFNDLVIQSNFDWKTSRDVEFKVFNISEGVLKVTSTEGFVYYKSFVGGKNQTVMFSVNLPNYLDIVYINGNLVEISGDFVDFTLPTLKSSDRGSYSLKFDGDDDYAFVSQPTGFDDITGLSIEAWVKFDELGGSYRWIVQKNSCFGLKLSPSGNSYKLTAIIYLNGRYNDLPISWNDRLKFTNVWYHLAFTWDGTWMRLYVNGELKKKRRLSGTILARNTSMTLGGNEDGLRVVGGDISEVRIWTVGRTYEQLIANMNSGLTGNEDGLTAYYPVNQGSDNVLYDLSPNSQNATINGAIWNSDVPFESNDTDGDGVVDNEDNYPGDADRAFNNYFPVNGYGSLAFEDMWPIKGDYDFNDLVVDYQFLTVTNSANKLVETYSSMVVKAFGAGMHNGFGFQLANNNLNDNITVSGSQIAYNYVSLNADGVEQNQNKPTIIVFDDAYNTLEYSGAGIGVNTTPGLTYVEPDTINILMEYTPNQFTLSDLDIFSFNPFMMANMERGKEIHLPDYPPTSLVEESYFGTEDDDSNEANGRFYKTTSNLPWALNIYETFSYTNEKIEILNGYNHFAEWANSSGTSFADWYLDNSGYRNNDAIYQIPEVEQ